jgi:hypothetical protein
VRQRMKGEGGDFEIFLAVRSEWVVASTKWLVNGAPPRDCCRCTADGKDGRGATLRSAGLGMRSAVALVCTR